MTHFNQHWAMDADHYDGCDDEWDIEFAALQKQRDELLGVIYCANLSLMEMVGAIKHGNLASLREMVDDAVETLAKIEVAIAKAEAA